MKTIVATALAMSLLSCSEDGVELGHGDPEGAVLECLEDNNMALVSGVSCVEPR